MGTFAGHALPGSLFSCYALWAIYHILRKFYRRRAYEMQISEQLEQEYESRVSHPLHFHKCGCCTREQQFPLDSLLKVGCCLIGIVGEFITGFDENWVFIYIGNAQHITMYSTFGLGGLIELCIFYKFLDLPLQTEHILSMTALLNEFLLFLLHLHGRTQLDVYIHMLLAGMIVLSLVAELFELISPKKVALPLIRWWGFLVQGTWFWQVGAILYPVASWMPTWDEQARQDRVRAANLFAYHLLIDFVVILIFAIPMSLKLGRINSWKASFEIETRTRTRTLQLSEPDEEDSAVFENQRHFDPVTTGIPLGPVLSSQISS
ncbi:unnamed protein product [Calicophoron daubneyi]|uniref:Transmembrane protein 45B n=1 Tax=Calicophoron daubneyi TaxID=300641 RepID=A0AAV2TYK4_CALDB